MKKPYSIYGPFWKSKGYKRSFYLAVLLVVLSLLVQIGAGHYSARASQKANFAGDLFLDNLPVVNLDFIVVPGALLFWIFGCFLLSLEPRRLLLGMKAIALLIIFRSFFVSLTHIGIYPTQIPQQGELGYAFYNSISFQGNFFFSGHTAFPFMMGLIFLDNKFWRRFFFLASAFFGISMLLAHAHYSIDVFAAPFMAYGIWKIAARIFPHDYALAEGRGAPPGAMPTQ